MVDTNFTLVSGTYTDVQHLLTELDFFLVNTVGGWVQEKVITDTGTDKNIAYYTDGSTSGTVYDRLWMRARAYNGYLQFNGLSYFDATTDTDYDQFGGQTDSFFIRTSATGTYWFAANKDAVHVVVDRSDGSPNHAGCGHFISYHQPHEDPKPVYIFGQVETHHTFASHVRLAAFGPHSWGTSYTTTLSGTSRWYEASHPTAIQYGTPNPRTGYPKLVEPVFFVDDTFGAYEVRGEVPGLYMCGGEGLTHGSLVEIKNMPPTVSGTYLIHKYLDSTSWAIGPVTVSGEG
jgi:hypothetical protein